MKYDDFKIPSDEEFAMINASYQFNNSYNRDDLILKIFNKINDLANSCLNIVKTYNLKINKSIGDTHTVLRKLLNNICELFDLHHPTSTINSIDIFSFLLELFNLFELLINWYKNEKKEYYKLIAKKSSKEIINSIRDILNALKNSNLYFFKHM